MKQKITRILAIPELPSHQQLVLEDATYVVVHTTLIENFGLRIGLEIEAETVEKIRAADEVMRAKNYALRLLREEREKEDAGTDGDDSARARPPRKPKIYTKSQIRALLEAQGFSPEAVNTAIAELIHSGYIRDRKYAESWVARRQKSNPRGKRVLKNELRDKGIDPETAEQVVGKIDTEDERRAAHQLAERRIKQYKRLPVQVAKRRLHGFLARRGFGPDIVRYVMDQIF